MEKQPLRIPRLDKPLGDIRSRLYGHLDTSLDEYAATGHLPRRPSLNKGVLRGLIELYAWGQHQVYRILNRILQQAVPGTATGQWLEVHADGAGLSRLPATKAQGKVRFYRGNGSGNVPIAKGRIVRTPADSKGQHHRYVTTEAGVISSGNEYAEVPCQAEEYGAAENVTAGQITELVTPVPGVSRVENIGVWLTREGADKETDEQLRERYRLRMMGDNGVTKHAYKHWAMGVAGVMSVSILDRHPRGQGTVDVVVVGSAGIPTPALLEQVEEAIAPHAPINDDWKVIPPEAVDCDVTGCVEYVNGDPEQILRACKDKLLQLFSPSREDGRRLDIGQDVTLDLLTYAVMSTDMIKNVDWQTPQADIPVAPNAMARLMTVTLTAVQVEP